MGFSTHILTGHAYAPVIEISKLIYCPQKIAIEETKAVFPSIRQRIADALQKLEEQFEAAQEKGATDEEITKAKNMIGEAKAVATQK